ncbi:MAG: DUF1552 domain-containing protein, partial [Lentisphaeraceae bacterium]|nr:DUF1552 domain-containing protein [Lentisphaeraceae bacterium]
MKKEAFWIRPKPLSRRLALKGLGVCLALPHLEAMAVKAETPINEPRRMVAILVDQGIVPWHFFPEKEGFDYEDTQYLKLVKDHKKDMTVLSGVALPEVDGGHHADICWLTGAPHPSRSGFRNTVSLDQVAAESIGDQTRFASLTLSTRKDGASLSWTRNGSVIPGESSAANLYKKLF